MMWLVVFLVIVLIVRLWWVRFCLSVMLGVVWKVKLW